jgi:hypothetical protein
MNGASAGRLVGVLTSPVKTFRELGEKPTWALALVVLVLCSVGLNLLASPRIDYEDIIKQTVAKSGRQVPQEQLDKQIEFMKKARVPLAFAGAVVAPILFALLALLPWVAFKLLGSDLDFRQSFSVLLHSLMPTVVLSLLSIPIVLSRATWGYQDLRSGGFLASNLAALFGSTDTRPALYTLMACIDFFGLWSLVLLMVGYREVAKVSTAKAATTIGVLWLLYVGIRVGWAALFG